MSEKSDAQPVTYVTEVGCPPTDDLRHQLRSHMKQPAPQPEAEHARPARCASSLCKQTSGVYPHGTYCPAHARMMAPRSQWTALGVPYPDGQEPARVPAAPALTSPVLTRLGFGPVEPFDAMYAPCPQGCGRPTAYLPGEPVPPCLGCEITPGRPAPEPEAEP